MEVLPITYKQLIYKSPYKQNEKQLSMVFINNMAIPLTDERLILTENQWSQVKSKVDKFYQDNAGSVSMLNNLLLAGQSSYRKQFGNVMESTRTSTGKALSGYVYILRAPNYPEFGYKIGYTSCVFNRLKSYSVAAPYRVEVLFAIYSNTCASLEKDLHERFKEKRTSAEWFKLSELDITWVKMNYDVVEVPRE